MQGAVARNNRNPGHGRRDLDQLPWREDEFRGVTHSAIHDGRAHYRWGADEDGVVALGRRGRAIALNVSLVCDRGAHERRNSQQVKGPHENGGDCRCVRR